MDKPIDDHLNDYFRKLNLEVTFGYDGSKKKFDTLDEFEIFINTEVEFWKSFTSGALSGIRQLFIQIKNVIEQSKNSAENEKAFLNTIENAIAITKDQKRFISSQTKIGQFLARQYRINYIRADVVYNLLIQKQTSINSNDFQSLSGAMAVYDFLIGETTRTDTENQTFDQVRAQCQKIITDIQFSYSKQESELLSLHRRLSQEVEDSRKKISENIDTHNKKFTDHHAQWTGMVASLEKQYGELMKLKKPAEYWNQLYEDYKKDGKKWGVWAGSVSGLFLIAMILLLYFFPEWMKGSEWTKDHVKGVVIFALIVSVFTYLINYFVRLSISSFHLSKDAKERYQLTYVYLAMISENNIDNKDREIVLQSLFSRADTGLLKNDGAPTMPNSIQSLAEAIRGK